MPYHFPAELDEHNPMLTNVNDNDADDGDGGGVTLALKPARQKRHDIHAELPDDLKDVRRAGYELLHDHHHHDSDASNLQTPPQAPLHFNSHPTTTTTTTPLSSRTIHVLTNYDHAAARFYTDSRIRHTGRPFPIPAPSPSRLHTLHLTVRSAWRVFATLELTRTPCAHVRVAVTSRGGTHAFPRAFRVFWEETALPFLEAYAVRRGGSGEEEEGEGFAWEDVRVLAGVFRYEGEGEGGGWFEEVDEDEDEEDGWRERRRRRGYAGNWMHEGVGFVDC